MNHSNPSIAITGYGIISAIGNNAHQTLLSLKEKRTGISSIKYLGSIHHQLPVGEVKLSNSQLASQLGIRVQQHVSRTAMLAATAVRQAIAMAGGPDILQGKRVTFLSGTTVGGMDITEQSCIRMKDDPHYVPPQWRNDCGSSTQESARIAQLSGVESTTISTACSSALNAIIVGAEMLRSRETDLVIAGGSEALSMFHLNGFNTLLILDIQQCRPFDASRAGLNLGEGAAYLILERTDEASARKIPIQGWIAGYGNACDAFHQTASSDNGEGAYLAMQKALQMAHMSPSDIDYINAHGTGTPNNDQSESQALKRIFSNVIPPVSSTKSFTGHTTSASGSIEAVISLLAMQNSFIPSNLGWKHAMPDGIIPTQGEDNITIHNVLCNSFGFGGNDSSLIISAAEPQRFKISEFQGSQDIRIASQSIIDSVEALTDFRKWISPMEARRMGKLLKAATITSLDALQKAGIQTPDAIVTATTYGMLETTEQFLTDMVNNHEMLLKPTQFMQSTHNTIGSSIAIRTKCHGYNITYSHGVKSFDFALRDAKRLIQTGQARTVLVGAHDEIPPDMSGYFRRMKLDIDRPEVYSKSIVLTL